jgi:predicted RNA binding protein YcfA (HicA-like mRNA interferase family)
VKFPRDESGKNLVKRLSKLGYTITRQTGSHIRLTTYENGEHHITIPDHSPIKIGTLNSIFMDVCEHFGIGKEELMKRLYQ